MITELIIGKSVERWRSRYIGDYYCGDRLRELRKTMTKPRSG
jgi:hypothetical protein